MQFQNCQQTHDTVNDDASSISFQRFLPSCQGDVNENRVRGLIVENPPSDVDGCNSSPECEKSFSVHIKGAGGFLPSLRFLQYTWFVMNNVKMSNKNIKKHKRFPSCRIQECMILWSFRMTIVCSFWKIKLIVVYQCMCYCFVHFQQLLLQ